MCIDRSLLLLSQQGSMSMIVPSSLVSTQRMKIVQTLLEKSCNVWYANYSDSPGKLFDTISRGLTIFTAISSKKGQTFSTSYQKSYSRSKNLRMYNKTYVEIPRYRTTFWAPKLGQEIEKNLLKNFLNQETVLELFTGKSEYRVYYRNSGGRYWKVFLDFPPAFKIDGKAGHSTRETTFSLVKKDVTRSVIAVLSSNIFWWWYTITSDCRSLNPTDIQNFPVSEAMINDSALIELGQIYLEDLQRNSTMKISRRSTGRTETQSFKIQESKHIIDEIDRVLADHYGFSEEELDFIINYDIKYRLGLGN